MRRALRTSELGETPTSPPRRGPPGIVRDAVPGTLDVGIGRGSVDFAGVIAALEGHGYEGSSILELETHDVAEADRAADARRSYDLITRLVEEARS